MRRLLLVLVGLFVVSSVVAQEDLNTTKQSAQTQTLTLSPINYNQVQQLLEDASKESWVRRTLRRVRNPLGDDQMLFGSLKLNSALGFGYTSETGFLLSAMLAGQYDIDQSNEAQTPSMLSLSVQGSVKLFFQVKASGKNYFGSDERILAYELSYGVLPIRFWGLGYDAADVNPRSNYSRRAFDVNASLMNRVVDRLYAGAALDLRYNKATALDELAESYVANQTTSRRNAFSVGLGAVAQYDSRDNSYSTTSGWFLSLLAEIRPKGFGDCGSTLWHIKATADYFTPLWVGGLLGVDLYADLWSSATPWFMWPCVGGGSRMRGYYFGRYTDRKLATAQVELRQHIYGPFGGVVWGGVGSVVDSHKNIDFSKLLPNYGLGLRIDLGKGSRLRIDYGFGRHSNGVVIGMNEAF
ncbi:MAG: BamA/TamA family outer membrane protein [Alistipes sp.]|nr:BamA/TamA family outer membrane protein [Alistipes sp.]